MVYYFVIKNNTIYTYDNITLPQQYKTNISKIHEEIQFMQQAKTHEVLKLLPKTILQEIQDEIITPLTTIQNTKIYICKQNPVIYANALSQLTGISKVIDKTTNKVLRSYPKPQFKTLKQLLQHLQKQYNAKQITMLSENCILINNRVKVWIRKVDQVFYYLHKNQVKHKHIKGFVITNVKGKP